MNAQLTFIDFALMAIYFAFVGHTIVPTITPLYESRVIAVQVLPHRDETTGAPIMEGLSIEGGTFFRAKIDGTREPLNLNIIGNSVAAIVLHSPVTFRASTTRIF